MTFVTADRGYESYDLIFHCELKHLNYVFRVKSPSSSKSMLSSFIDELPDDKDEFDVSVTRFFTDKKTKIMKHQSQNKYHYQVDFSSALRIARKYFWRDSRTEKDIIHLMIKYVSLPPFRCRNFLYYAFLRQNTIYQYKIIINHYI